MFLTILFQNSASFTTGNYYEVVYISLKKNIYEKDIEVTKALFECFPYFLKNLPLEVKVSKHFMKLTKLPTWKLLVQIKKCWFYFQKTKLDDVFSSVIDQLNTETNLYRKAVCFDFTTKIIEMHGVHCVKKGIFKDIICDNLEMCCNEGVYEILIEHVMEVHNNFIHIFTMNSILSSFEFRWLFMVSLLFTFNVLFPNILWRNDFGIFFFVIIILCHIFFSHTYTLFWHNYLEREFILELIEFA